MKPVKPAAMITTVFLGLIAVGHLIRLVLRVPVTVDGIAIPVWASVLGAAFTATLAVLLWRESRVGPAAGRA